MYNISEALALNFNEFHIKLFTGCYNLVGIAYFNDYYINRLLLKHAMSFDDIFTIS